MSKIAITLGDVAGIGPEVIQKALKSPKLNRSFEYEIVLSDRAPKVVHGKISKAAARFAIESLEEGVEGCRKSVYAALVTGPVNKAALHQVGFKFPGQTEWLASKTKTRRFAMMLTGGGLRVILCTIHLPIREVSPALSKSSILEKIQLTFDWLQTYGIRKPRIFVAALNPHGGVGTEAGKEENKTIVPAIKRAQKRFGTQISGPYSPDYLFWAARKERADAVICMYHDQGLIPLKMLAFDEGVNVTLGLPIIRTSPDHGTAYDIAGKNKASASSMIEALNLAADIALKRAAK